MKPAIAICVAAMLGEVAGSATSDTNERVFARAQEALEAGSYAAAEAGFRQVLQKDPHNVGALGNLGVVYSRTHRFALAIASYKQALRASPGDQGILLNLGLAYLKQNDYPHALPFFRRLHALRPQNGQATNLLATCLVFGGHPQAAAIDLFKPVAEKCP